MLSRITKVFCLAAGLGTLIGLPWSAVANIVAVGCHEGPLIESSNVFTYSNYAVCCVNPVGTSRGFYLRSDLLGRWPSTVSVENFCNKRASDIGHGERLKPSNACDPDTLKEIIQSNNRYSNGQANCKQVPPDPNNPTKRCYFSVDYYTYNPNASPEVNMEVGTIIWGGGDKKNMCR